MSNFYTPQNLEEVLSNLPKKLKVKNTLYRLRIFFEEEGPAIGYQNFQGFQEHYTECAKENEDLFIIATKLYNKIQVSPLTTTGVDLHQAIANYNQLLALSQARDLLKTAKELERLKN